MTDDEITEMREEALVALARWRPEGAFTQASRLLTDARDEKIVALCDELLGRRPRMTTTGPDGNRYRLERVRGLRYEPEFHLVPIDGTGPYPGPEDEGCPEDPDGQHFVGCGCDHTNPDDPEGT